MFVSKRISFNAVIRVRKGAICTVFIVNTFEFRFLAYIINCVFEPLNTYGVKYLQLKSK